MFGPSAAMRDSELAARCQRQDEINNPLGMGELNSSPTRCFVRYLGTRACFTNRHGGFVMVDREELSENERAACDRGGGYVILSDTVYAGLQWK